MDKTVDQPHSDSEVNEKFFSTSLFIIQNVYLEISVSNVNAENCFDEGANQEITDGDVSQENIVGAAGELGEVSESDAEQNIGYGSDQSEEQLREDQQHSSQLLHVHFTHSP